MRIKRIGLEYHGKAALIRRCVVNTLTVYGKIPTGNFLKPRNHAQKRRFSRTGRPHENHEFAVRYVEIDPFYDVNRAEGFGGVLQ